MFRGPSRSDSNASSVPSGLKAERISSLGWAVSRSAIPPAAATDHRSPAYEKTIAEPSGPIEGYCGKATGGAISFGVAPPAAAVVRAPGASGARDSRPVGGWAEQETAKPAAARARHSMGRIGALQGSGSPSLPAAAVP